MSRYQSSPIFQPPIPPSRKERALRFLADGCAWIGESFIGISYTVLSKIRKPDDCGSPEEVSARVLLPAHGIGTDQNSMREQVITYQCPGCFRVVQVILQIEGLPRCEDCREVSNDQKNQFVNYGNN